MTDEEKFREVVKKMNHMLHGMTYSMEHLFRAKKQANVALLTVGDKTLTVTPRNIMTVYRQLQILEQNLSGEPIFPSYVLDLLLNK